MMLSQLRPVDDAAHTYARPAPVALRLPSLRMSLPAPALSSQYSHHHHHAEPHAVYASHHYDHHQRQRLHHHHPYQRPFQPLPALSAPALIPAAPMLPTVSSPSSESSHKCSLAFILSEPSSDATAASAALPLQRTQSESETSSDGDALENDPLDRPHSLKHKRRATTSGSPVATGSKSKYCIVEGCTSRAKHARKCWRHGGSVKCKVQDCINRAKSRGVCWSHGGGTTCSHPNCGTIAVSHGFCWAHGGGKRCEVGGCSRPAYERTQNLCSTHFKQHKAAAKAAAAPY